MKKYIKKKTAMSRRDSVKKPEAKHEARPAYEPLPDRSATMLGMAVVAAAFIGGAALMAGIMYAVFNR